MSLFSNGVVVVTIRRDDKQELLRRMTLAEDQYMVYLAVIQQNTRELGVRPVTSSVETSHAEVVLSLHAGLDTPRTIRFSPMSSVKLPLAKILGALDDLQLQALEASPSEEAMREWRPRKGDRVELLTGKTATVAEVWDDGMVILELDGTYVRESVPVDLRSQIILRVLRSVN